MQLLTIDMGWNVTQQIRGVTYQKEPAKDAISDAAYESLREMLELPPVEERAEANVKSEFIGTLDDVNVLCRAGIIPSIKRVRGMMIAETEMPVRQQLVSEEFPRFDGGPSIINLTIPNAALFAVRTLMVIENECTNRVQQLLDEGWRIVAVCPPNDTRRPDYILGHMEKK